MRINCDNNHPYTPENTLIDQRTGARRCRTCNRIRSQDAYRRRMEKVCRKGHERTSSNTAIDQQGRTLCLDCRKDWKEVHAPVAPIRDLRPIKRAWHEDAICPQFGLDVFVPELNDNGFNRSMHAMTREAREVCTGCPVIADCAREALSHKPWGVWAGLSFMGSVTAEQRRQLVKLAQLDQQAAS